MDRFQIVEIAEQLNHAGTKATADIAIIADRLGFKRLNVKMDSLEDSAIGKIKRQIGYFRDWRKAEKEINAGSLLLLQHPFHYPQITRKKTLKKIKNKNVKIISVVHDVEELRAFRFNEYYKHEFETMIELADVIIVHNNVMKNWFKKKGVEENKIISLEIFDYLGGEEGEINKNINFERSITIAGNLDTVKCGYIGQLGLLENVKVHLYGPNFDNALLKYDNIEYHGSFPTNEISQKLNKGFGLVWDGDSIEGCLGQSGQYLRYNNPHKLSLYLSSGLPVIIWKEAAEAEFVKDRGVGFAVENVYELEDIFNTMTVTDWKTVHDNVNKIKELLRNGFFASKAINEAIKQLIYL